MHQRDKTIKLLEKTSWCWIWQLFLDMAVKAWETEEKIIWILSKLEKLCVSINRINSQQDDREELQTKYKGVNISDYIKNSHTSTIKKLNNLIKRIGKGLDDAGDDEQQTPQEGDDIPPQHRL